MKFSLRHKSTGRLYPYVEIGGNLMLRAFMRKIYVYNRHVVPTDKPVLLASNHPTAFIDPCLLGVFLDPPLYNMTRGDLFSKPFFRMLMESINMFPVFRKRDGYTGRHRNDEVFEFCRHQLEQKQVVTIYVEGEHHLERRVRPIQKGIARIAFGTYEQHQLDDLQIIPAGCNYKYGDRPRDTVMVNFGTPIFIKDYWADYQRDPVFATARLLASIQAGLKKICLHIDDPADDTLADMLLTLTQSEYAPALIPIVEYSNRRFLAEKAVCDRINAMPKPQKLELEIAATQYLETLTANSVQDDALMHPEWARWPWLLFFILGLLPFLLGYITSLPVIMLAQNATRKLVRKREFLSSVHMGVGFVGGVVYYFLWFVGSLFTRNPWWIALGLGLPILGWFSMYYRETWTRWFEARRARRHPERSRLLALRQVLQQHEPLVEGV